MVLGYLLSLHLFGTLPKKPLPVKRKALRPNPAARFLLCRAGLVHKGRMGESWPALSPDKWRETPEWGCEPPEVQDVM